MALAHQVLRDVFGYSAFRGQQAEVVQHLMEGSDALVLMPTGGGKSLCYQVPAIARHRSGLGVSVVVSPLIALMHDQVGALEEAGVHAAFLNSTLDIEGAREIEHELLSGRLVLLYAAPERILTPRFLAMLTSLHERGQLSLFAIDEAHCVSQWGHDFRAEYLGLSTLHERFPNVPRVALTATADAHTRADIIERLALQSARPFIDSFDRPNIRYHIVEKNQSRQQLLRFIRDEHAGDAGIVYCHSRKKVEDTAQWLSQEGIAALAYHAGLDATTRRERQDRFLREEGCVMVATVAFGMGIDKPDVRFVAHVDMPKSVEGYFQETGRAGRDGLPAQAWMTYGLADVVQQRRFIETSEADETYKRLSTAKLDAMLALAEAGDCRRVRLLAYFGEASAPCGNCDNCLNPPARIDATEAARKLLSCIYRCEQKTGFGFAATHIIDVLRGKTTEKVEKFGHETLSTFGIGAELTEQQWRTLLRQLVALHLIEVDYARFNVLRLTEASRAVLKGERTIWLREASEVKTRRRSRKGGASAAQQGVAAGPEEALFDALRAWRAQTAKEHGVPAYVVFHDGSLRAIAQLRPRDAFELGAISGVGEKKLERYGSAILALIAAMPAP